MFRKSKSTTFRIIGLGMYPPFSALSYLLCLPFGDIWLGIRWTDLDCPHQTAWSNSKRPSVKCARFSVCGSNAAMLSPRPMNPRRACCRRTTQPSSVEGTARWLAQDPISHDLGRLSACQMRWRLETSDVDTSRNTKNQADLVYEHGRPAALLFSDILYTIIDRVQNFPCMGREGVQFI